MKFIDLFSGIGGFRTGMEMNGHECVAFCEIDKYARQSYKAIYDTEGEEEWHDITQVSNDDFRTFKLLEDEQTLLQEDFHVKPFQLPGNAEGLQIQGERFSLTLQGRLKKSNHLMLYWKTSKAYSHTTKGELSEQSFKRWMNWGMSLNGVCLTVNSGEYPKIENEYLY